MDILTKYVVYEKISLANEYNDTKIGIKIRGIYNNIKDVENAFNTLQDLKLNVFIDTLTNFHSKFSIIYK